MRIFRRKKIYSEITLEKAIQMVKEFCPAKILFNNIVLYNDYDSKNQLENGWYGEGAPSRIVVPERIKDFKNSIVASIDIEIIDYHHSIIKMKGKLIKEDF